MRHVLLWILLACCSVGPAFAGATFKEFSGIPIQNEGRVKPLDSFARAHLLAFNGKEEVEGLSPSAWLAELLFDPDRAYLREVFNLSNPDAVTQLGLERKEKHRYSFKEVFPRLREQSQLLQSLRDLAKELRTPAQNQLLDLNAKAARFFEISRSLSLLLPVFQIEDGPLAKLLALNVGETYNYIELLRVREAVRAEVKKGNVAAEKLALGFEAIEGWTMPEVLRLFPPQFRGGKDWGSPWQVVQEGDGSPEIAKAIALWRAVAVSYRAGKWDEFSAKSAELNKHSHQMTKAFIGAGTQTAELIYNEGKFFQKAVAFFIGSFLFLLMGWIFWGERLRKIAFAFLIGGTVFSLLGVCLRMFIMGRPPVSTLYESILFVALIAALFACVIERIKKDGLGILIGSVACASLLFVSFGYAAEGDTMGVLVAVLNTNFWLATHVVCITIGYGICIVGGVLGHIYLVSAAFRKKPARLSELYQSMLGVSLVGLFFATFGTILGGIWADQSWGRFWGWDPKENGALLIVLWLLFLLHGRISGIVTAPGFALGMVLTNVIVALAWFGVNLLNVGLHSYGFTENIALNLFLFCLGELSFGLITYHHAKLRILSAALKGAAH